MHRRNGCCRFFKWRGIKIFNRICYGVTSTQNHGTITCRNLICNATNVVRYTGSTIPVVQGLIRVKSTNNCGKPVFQGVTIGVGWGLNIIAAIGRRKRSIRVGVSTNVGTGYTIRKQSRLTGFIIRRNGIANGNIVFFQCMITYDNRTRPGIGVLSNSNSWRQIFLSCTIAMDVVACLNIPNENLFICRIYRLPKGHNRFLGPAADKDLRIFPNGNVRAFICRANIVWNFTGGLPICILRYDIVFTRYCQKIRNRLGCFCRRIQRHNPGGQTEYCQERARPAYVIPIDTLQFLPRSCTALLVYCRIIWYSFSHTKLTLHL